MSSENQVDELTAQIEAELNEYLNSTPSISISNNETKPPTISNLPSSTPNISGFDENDFLSWLEETPERSVAPSTIEKKPIEELDLDDVAVETPPVKDLSLSMFPTPNAIKAEALKSSPSLATRSMDSLFDEIFGKDRPESRTASPMNAISSITVKADNQPIYIPPSRRDFEEKLNDLIVTAVAEGGLSDVSPLRQLISDAGYIPSEHRLSVWLLLLTGGRYTPDTAAGEVT